MDRSDQLSIFKAQTLNVRRLGVARKQVQRSINRALRRADLAAEEAHTLVLALLYCAWLEAMFLKLICTPHGFSLDEIEQIKAVQDGKGIRFAWMKCVELGVRRLSNGSQSNEAPNIRRRLERLIDDFVQSPAELRNRIAHGQWEVALNRTRDAVNAQVTARIASIDIVELDRWHCVANGLAHIVEALIESPTRHFRAAYWARLESLEADRIRMTTWTRQSRVDALRTKPSRPRAPRTDVPDS